MTHLSAREIAGWVAGERPAALELHVAGCPRCCAEIADFEETLAGFRSSARFLTVPLPPAALRPAPAPGFRRPLAWLFIAAAAAMVMLVPLYRDRAARERAILEQQDAQLLQQVDAEISRAVPDSMDPLVKMVAWNSGSTNANEGQK